ncbi:MAG TPA: cation-translocating P-type ATPase [Stellaceae bacterium]|nr:cation-translocating P-type ATPase [Stellaceae bacterium]
MTGRPSGLTEAEAARRLAEDGPNDLGRQRRRDLPRILLDVLREPMLQLLLAAGIIYLLLGDLGEAVMLLCFALFDIGLVTVQESRSERTLAALKELTSPHAIVLRDGVERRIGSREVVRGDVLLVTEGDRVPADAVLLESNDLAADESLLTGESIAVPKSPGGEQSGIHAGTVLVSGRGIAEVTATGARSELGKIGLSLAQIETADTPLHRQTRRLVAYLAVLGIGLSAALALLYGFLRGGWLEGVLAGITLAMSLLPEEFPVVLGVFFVFGAWRIAQQGVLTRRSAAIETLGSATVLCTDKTGTLTQNRMAVARLFATGVVREIAPGVTGPLSARHERLLRYAVLASETAPFDPMETAFHELGARCLGPAGRVPADWRLVHEYGLTPDLPAMTHVWAVPGNAAHVVAVKGAPEAVMSLCRLDPEAAAAVRAGAEAMAADGLRVLGVASGSWSGTSWPRSPRDIAFEFLGLAGLADPVRPDVPEAIARCRKAGIRVVMVTGDHPLTAAAIARQAGLADGGIVTGAELKAMSDAELAERAPRTTIFARVTPGQKLRLVEAFKTDGEIVGMTGDGVNDAPSLKAAHIGIAMGKRGTDVAREAAALVLLEDDFTAIVSAIHLGRRIYDNLRKAMSYVMGVHVAIAGTALLPILFGWPPILFPVHVVFIEMIVDSACSIVFEAEPAESDAMTRPPRDPREPLFGRTMIMRSSAQGLGALGAVIAVAALARAWGFDEESVRGVAFSALVLSNIGAIFANRSADKPLLATFARPNPWLWWGLGISLAALALALYAPGLNALFRFEPPTAGELAFAIAAALMTVAWSELLKRTVPPGRGAPPQSGASS